MVLDAGSNRVIRGLTKGTKRGFGECQTRVFPSVSLGHLWIQLSRMRNRRLEGRRGVSGIFSDFWHMSDRDKWREWRSGR